MSKIRNTARQDRKTNNRQKPEMKSIKSGQAMEENSIGSSALSSSTSNDSQRAVGTNHQKNNSTDERVLASGDTDGQRAVGTNHQKDNSTNSRVLASGPTNADRAVDTTHVRDGAIRTKFNGDGSTDFSHLQQDTVGGRELLSHASQNALRAVAKNHLKDGIVNADKIQDGQVTNAKLAGDIPGSKLAQNYALADSTYNKGATDDRFLKSDKHPQFGAGHGNDHHDPDFQPKNAPKSIAFNSLPTDAIERILAKRNQIRSNRDAGNTSAAAIANLQEGYLHLAHLLLDSPEMNGDAGLAAIQSNADYREVWSLMQTIAAPENAWFLNNRGPDIASVGGVYGSLGPTDQAWYPPKEMSLVSSGVMTNPSANTLRADFSSVPNDQWVYFVVSGRSPNLADYTFTNYFNWNRIFPEPVTGQNRYVQIFRKQKTSSDATLVDIAFSGSAANLPFNGVWFSVAEQGSINQKTSQTAGLIPETGMISVMGQFQYPRGLSFHSLVVDGQNYDFDLGGGLAEITRNQLTVNGLTSTLITAYRYSEAGDVQPALPITVKNAATGVAVSNVRYNLLATNAQSRKKNLIEARAEANL